MIDILRLVKEDYIKNRLEVYSKYSITEEELLKKWDEFEQDGIEFGMIGQFLEDYVRKRIKAHYSKLERIPPGVDFYGIALGINVTDYGAKKGFDEAMKKYNEDQDQAIRDGFVKLLDNGEVVPLYRNNQFRNGKAINIEEAKTKQVLMLAKQANEEYKVSWLNLSGFRSKLEVPLFKELK